MWALLQRRYDAGKPCEPLESHITLYLDVMDVWEAFWTLHSGRDYSDSGPLPLKISEIKAYCDLFPPVRGVKDLVSLIYALDREYLAHVKKETEKRLKQKTKGDQKKKTIPRQQMNPQQAPRNGRHNNKRRS